MSDPRTMLVHIDAAIDVGDVVALQMSPQAFKMLKDVVPRREYRKRTGTRFVNAYRGIPIEIHDEWAWGWMVARVTDVRGRVMLHGEFNL